MKYLSHKRQSLPVECSRSCQVSGRDTVEGVSEDLSKIDKVLFCEQVQRQSLPVPTYLP